MDLTIKRLHQIILEMQDGHNYYAQPQRDQQVSCVMPGKMEEWISRLSMVEEGLRYTQPSYKCLLCGRKTYDKKELLGPCNEPECMGVLSVINKRKGGRDDK